MFQALTRFGLPVEVVTMIRAFYPDRSFTVRDNGQQSNSRPQSSGIAQGCPLSPYLFVIVLSVILCDVAAAVPIEFSKCCDIAYADDTVLTSTDADCLQKVLDSLLSHARQYGLEPNWGKTVHLQIQHDKDILDSDGQAIRCFDQAVYLGGLLRVDGCTAAVLARRLGETRGMFEKLVAVWKHANLTKERKLTIYRACVLSKLLFSLEVVCMRKANTQRLNAFHCSCVRRILGIPHSMFSHITNTEVLRQAGEQPLSQTLLRRQLLFYGRLVASPDHSLLRQTVIQPGSALPKQLVYAQRRGRPRLSWISVMYGHASKAVDSRPQSLQDILCGISASLTVWRTVVADYCRS
ncbi:unnamed protein product [Polarella glacialis]|uniref:Reverse transcriptase domain-containing protein n=1 Tax=Polarella glacialis TaxID=89957 RepID=A0A813FPG1_POLGL|nr:unnamed protein product [Polarella glacialis]